MALLSTDRYFDGQLAVDADGRLRVVIDGASGSGSSTVDTELPAAAVPADNATNAAIPAVASRLQGFDGSTWDLLRAAVADGLATGVLATASYGYNASIDAHDRFRIPTTFKTVNATAITAGTAASIWTPTAGKKFRVMGITFSVSAAASLILWDNANTSIIFRSPLLAAAGTYTLGAGDLGNGILSAAANNVLKLDVSATATVTGTVFGTEE